ncbi:hypothetical protein [Mucilaginibacter glaciei]|uniref:DUF5640 domain-containing protein n=1 Tax=Mucilaginibacter glaciei TaxID=2772109 RepID=A0A926NQD6_9SPHI|nr:hypothetical protein [Mucilaginibacter glaciei]MBD1392765.1 hypothetical protein [Mucilaginibacter glaciei]
MKNLTIINLSACLFVLAAAACTSNSGKQTNPKLPGTWKSKDGVTVLKITDKQFTLEDGAAPVAEDYFIKGDTIFTSFEGNQPYTKFVIQKLDDHSMKLMFPDSVAIEFVK